jgi:hypothetical protein
MIFMIDQNLEGYAEILLGAIASKRWLDLLPIQFITFAEIELPPPIVPIESCGDTHSFTT